MGFTRPAVLTGVVSISAGTVVCVIVVVGIVVAVGVVVVGCVVVLVCAGVIGVVVMAA